jgi:hypothetical protein
MDGPGTHTKAQLATLAATERITRTLPCGKGPAPMPETFNELHQMDTHPSEILRALEQQQAPASQPEARKSVRHYYTVPLVVQLQDRRAGAVRTIRVATNNVSAGGFAFIFDANVEPGATVRAQFDSLPGKPCITGTVRSCVHLCGTQHRIGVEFKTS